jgi:hypothetical protein
VVEVEPGQPDVAMDATWQQHDLESVLQDNEHQRDRE